MKKITILILSLMILIMNVQVATADTNVFFDVPEGHWGYKDIKAAYQEGILNGTGVDGKTGKIIFQPNGDLTAAQFITVLGKSFYPYEMKEFAAQGGSWHTPAFRVANNHNLLRNTDLYENFQRKITRYEFAQILYNLIDDFSYEMPNTQTLKGMESKIGDFSKVRKSGYDKAVLVCVHYGLISGVDSRGTFYGEKTLTRAQLASFYMKSREFRDRLLRYKAQDTGLRGQGKILEQNANISAESGKNVMSKAQSKSEEFRQEVLSLVNQERKSRGIAALKPHNKLEEMAQSRADELLTTYDHTRPDGRSCFSILDDNGVHYFACGENIAAGYRTPKDVVNAWMNSKGHRDNILNPDFLYMGTGYTSGLGKGTEYEDYWAQLFLRQ